MTTPDLKKAVKERDWGETSRILKEHPDLAEDNLSEVEFDILWLDAPLEVIQSLLKVWPKAYEMKGSGHGNLAQTNVDANRWDFLKSILHTFPNLITAEDVYKACLYKKNYAPIDVFKLMLDQQPNAPLEKPDITFNTIRKNKLEHFRAVLDRCPAATTVEHRFVYLTPLLYIFQNKEQISMDWISPVLKANSDAARKKDFDGKNPLHLAYQHGASSDLVDMILKAYPEAENERDNLGRFPKDLANQSEKAVFTPANESLILRDNLNAEKKPYPDNAVVVCRGDVLMRDPNHEQHKYIFGRYAIQVAARHHIFKTLLSEFSKMVGIKDKDVIQKAAAIQALLAHCLSNKNGTIIDFELFGNPGYWFQQEILKLVMRVYHETQSESMGPCTTMQYDADTCLGQLDDTKNGKPSPKPSDEYVNAYNNLSQWLTDGFDKSSYSLQGPVLKPLQSLFNKLFIRRGQASVSIIGDLVRATLLVDEFESLQNIIERIKTTFPNITEKKFRQPDQFDRVADFLTYVHDDLNFLPDSHVLPYRFKANSSQKEKEEPLWYNFNFFLQIPEYHRVGFSEMFVACELQIGLAEEINAHRRTHVAYERDRILLSQPLLKNYDAMEKEMNKQDSQPLKKDDDDDNEDKCTEDDNRLIEKVLFGKIASEVLIPCPASAGNDNKSNHLLFEMGPLSFSWDTAEAGTFVKPERPCLNNRSLNWYARDCPKKDTHGNISAAFRVAGSYKLDETKRYFVESLVCKNVIIQQCFGTVGLYAHIGPYMIQIACSVVTDAKDDVVVVKSGRNFTYLEQLCPVPVGTTALEVIFYGYGGEMKYDAMELSLSVFDLQ